MLTSVLIMSLGLLVRNSRQLQVSCSRQEVGGMLKFTWASVNWFWFPVRITIIFNLLLLERLDRFVFIYKGVATVLVTNQIRNDTSNCIGTISAGSSSISWRIRNEELGTSNNGGWVLRPWRAKLPTGQSFVDTLSLQHIAGESTLYRLPGEEDVFDSYSIMGRE